MIQWYDDADAEVTLPLACDPDTRAANDTAAIVRYMSDGDVSRIVVPPGATQVTLRPLTDAEMHRAAQDAGAAPQLGAILTAEADEVSGKARDEGWAEAEAALGREERTALNEWRDAGLPVSHPGAEVGNLLAEKAGEAGSRAHAAFIDALAPDERASVDAMIAWRARRDRNILRAGWVAWVGQDIARDGLIDALDRVRPLSVQRAMRAELVQHIQRMSVMPPLGKAQSASQSSEATQTPCTPGHAQTAAPEDSGEPEATAAS